jgi:hypothetical protein
MLETGLAVGSSLAGQARGAGDSRRPQVRRPAIEKAEHLIPERQARAFHLDAQPLFDLRWPMAQHRRQAGLKIMRGGRWPSEPRGDRGVCRAGCKIGGECLPGNRLQVGPTGRTDGGQLLGYVV